VRNTDTARYLTVNSVRETKNIGIIPIG